jgi:hypothetical protein
MKRALLIAAALVVTSVQARTILPEPTVFFQPLPIVCVMDTQYQQGGGMYPYPVFRADKPLIVAGCTYKWFSNLIDLINYIREVNIRPELEN